MDYRLETGASGRQLTAFSVTVAFLNRVCCPVPALLPTLSLSVALPLTMGTEQDWDDLLRNHPIFSVPKRGASSARVDAALNLSLSSLPDFVDLDPAEDKATPCGRRQAVAVKDADLITAVGSEIRITSLGDSKGARNTSQKVYKVRAIANLQYATLLNLTGSCRSCILPQCNLKFIRLP